MWPVIVFKKSYVLGKLKKKLAKAIDYLEWNNLYYNFPKYYYYIS